MGTEQVSHTPDSGASSDVRDSDAPGMQAPALTAPPPRSRALEVVATVLLSVAVFALHWWLANGLFGAGAMEGMSRLFGADTAMNLGIAKGESRALQLVHPVYYEALRHLVMAASRLPHGPLGDSHSGEATGRAVVLLISPLSSALLTAVMVRLLRRMGLLLRDALALALLSSVSFSRVIFGSIPETYAPSALVLACSYWLYARTPARKRPGSEVAWLALACAASCITITNIMPVAVLRLFRERKTGAGIAGAVTRTALFSVIAVAVAVGLGTTAVKLREGPRQNIEATLGYVRRFIDPNPWVGLATFPTAVANSVAPPMPALVRAGFWLSRSGTLRHPRVSLPEAVCEAREEALGASPNPAGREPGAGGSRITLQHTHEVLSARNLVSAALLALLAWVTLRRRRADPLERSLYAASALILCYNWLLHGFWGDEEFLYSMHWHVPLVVLMAIAVLAIPSRWRRLGTSLLAVVAAACAANSARIILALLDHLSVG